MGLDLILGIICCDFPTWCYSIVHQLHPSNSMYVANGIYANEFTEANAYVGEEITSRKRT